MLTLRRILATAVLLALAGQAHAQDAGRRQGQLLALSRALGESQALREACEGKQDQYWRSRMMRLLALENLEGATGAPLTAAFNAGYTQTRAAFPDCGPDSRRAEVDAAVRGQELAVLLAGPAPAAASETGVPDDVAASPDAR